MRRFQFRFQRLLELKESQEQSRQGALAEALALRQTEQDRLNRLQETRESHLRAGRPPPGADVSVDLLALGAYFSQRLEREIIEQREQVQQVDTVVSRRRDELLEATKERRVFEVLRDKAAESHRRQQRRQERIWLDEVGTQLHLRRGNELVESGSDWERGE